MRFETNCDYNIYDRIELVSKEIIECYPDIDILEGKMIASLTKPIGHVVTLENKFDRYYNMLLVLDKRNKNFNSILLEICNLYKKGFNNIKLIETLDELIKYKYEERVTFPM